GRAPAAAPSIGRRCAPSARPPVSGHGEECGRSEREPGGRGKAGGEARRDAVGAAARRGGEVVDLRAVGEEEEGVEVAEIAGRARRAVEISLGGALAVQ